MDAKDAVRALLDRLPDDCTLDEIIDRLYEIEVPGGVLAVGPGLTDAQRAELDRRLDLLQREPDRTIPWAALRLDLEHDE